MNVSFLVAGVFFTLLNTLQAIYRTDKKQFCFCSLQTLSTAFVKFLIPIATALVKIGRQLHSQNVMLIVIKPSLVVNVPSAVGTVPGRRS